MSDFVPVEINATVPAGTAVELYWQNLSGAKVVLDPASFHLVGAAVGADDTDYLTITVVNGSTNLALWVTTAANEGALSAGANDVTPEATALGTALEVASEGVLKMTVVQAGSGKLFQGGFRARARRV